MNILYVCGDDPRKTGTGMRQRNNFIWVALRSIGTVYTIVPVCKKEGIWCDEAEKIKGVYLEQGPIWARCLDVIMSKITKVGSWPGINRKEYVERKVWPGISYDYCVTRYVNAASMLSAWKIAPTIIDIDDVPIQAFRRLCQYRLPFGLRNIGACLTIAWQRYVLSHSASAWVVQKGDMKLLPKGLRCGVLPNRAMSPKAEYQIDGGQRNILLTVGLMSYKPNYEGVDWFIEKIWPMVRKLYPDMTYVIAGGELSDAYKKKWASVPGVLAVGFVDDIDALYESSLAAVAPIKIGAGSCIKVVEAPLRGRKMFATPYAAHALSQEARDALGIECFSGAEDFISRLVKWINAPQYSRRRDQARFATNAKLVNSFESFACIVQRTFDEL